MFGRSTEVQSMARALAAHAAARQGVIAHNVANADTPGFRAAEIASFADVYTGQSQMPLRATRAGHIAGGARQLEFGPRAAPGETSPNGNSVSLEREMMQAADARHQHELALAITRSLGSVIRTSLRGAR